MSATASDSNEDNLVNNMVTTFAKANNYLFGIPHHVEWNRFPTGGLVVYAVCGVQYYLRYSKNSPITSHSNNESKSGTPLCGTFTQKLKHMTDALIFYDHLSFHSCDLSYDGAIGWPELRTCC